MTLEPSAYHFLEREYPMFILWAINKDILFFPRNIAEVDEDKQYDLMSKLYVLMKRLGQSYETLMLMDEEERDTFFDMELKLIKEEAKNNKKE